ncbi:MAG: purine-nucleoside phosphorylase [Ignavibacteriaceae bacterium]|nr:purine-nucleoside phosphorylase [Ignavibacteriaceae bacterium]
MIDLNFKYQEAISYLKKESPFTPDIAIVLGSGLGEFADSTKKIKSLSTSEIPGYPKTTVRGHQGAIHFSKVEKKNILIFQGRLHFYEGYKISDCLLGVLLSNKLGCKKIIFTNAAGGVNRNFAPGDLMLIDSFNALQLNKEITSLIGVTSIEVRNNFLNCPSKRMNEIFMDSAKEIKIPLHSGTYWYSKGPSYETPAEINLMYKFGGDAVGMSTVHEAIYASLIGMKTAAISCITNLAAGISLNKLSHEEVTETANKVKSKFERLVRRVISFI